MCVFIWWLFLIVTFLKNLLHLNFYKIIQKYAKSNINLVLINKTKTHLHYSITKKVTKQFSCFFSLYLCGFASSPPNMPAVSLFLLTSHSDTRLNFHSQKHCKDPACGSVACVIPRIKAHIICIYQEKACLLSLTEKRSSLSKNFWVTAS